MPPASAPRGSTYLTALTLAIEKNLLQPVCTLCIRIYLLICAYEFRSCAAFFLFNAKCTHNMELSHFQSFLYSPDCFSLFGSLSTSNIKCIWYLHHSHFMFEVQLDNPQVLLHYSSAFVQGATNVFWYEPLPITCMLYKKHFLSLFHYLLEAIAPDFERLKKIPPQVQRDVFLLLSRFIFFYNSILWCSFGILRGGMQFPGFPNVFLIGGTSDVFVTELADQLQKLKVKPVLLHYLSQIKVLQRLELRMTSSTRLETCLYSFASPGGLLYPMRVVRHAARDALNFLFPLGHFEL
ncbi:hypothetical protein CDL12_15957 [Handroanthus impetiginosus]|uniref:Uncharacterized protein n=1 Tax=Handroanthus impetiginosus TaxID=429701 RepID=A0A2G9H1N9_9LAMI|nr:hypothetical protein CDL12_15957 [Handroanthus impetiginosus]